MRSVRPFAEDRVDGDAGVRDTRLEIDPERCWIVPSAQGDPDRSDSVRHARRRQEQSGRAAEFVETVGHDPKSAKRKTVDRWKAQHTIERDLRAPVYNPWVNPRSELRSAFCASVSSTSTHLACDDTVPAQRQRISR